MKGRVIGSLVLAAVAMVMIVFVLSKPSSLAPSHVYAQHETGQNKEDAPAFIGVNVRGLYTSLQHERYSDSAFP